MADESETGVPGEVAEMEAQQEVPVTKKQRAPRRSKAEIEAATARSPKVRQKRTPRAEPIAADGEKPGLGASKKTAVKAKPITVPATPATSVAASDEMADLIQLEEENQRLRHALADKLRAENADLRKRLGV
ncbi:SyrB-like regulator [Rhizobium tumorigenes]|uniref:SyrB-like regulator n=1 Tax=Rhizobium tumorigenes TaxID=2041385 RepID=A0AAF1K861_9HYPH|nr:SyrB-like regulator [Rhizobium tumorigenes]WFR97852.1 SyrB-like regulator [Rhizobium tumorigenes]WFS03411.1 SyrB-like regulator [Rhizobium tumorigenes]